MHEAKLLAAYALVVHDDYKQYPAAAVRQLNYGTPPPAKDNIQQQGTRRLHDNAAPSAPSSSSSSMRNCRRLVMA